MQPAPQSVAISRCNQQARAHEGNRGRRNKQRVIFHGRFLRCEKFLLQNSAILRYPLRKLNDRITCVSNGVQRSENKRKNSFLN
jgi:hypothetical protein